MNLLTAEEMLGTLLATFCFALLMVPVGYLLGWCSDVCRFRTRSRTEQLLWSSALSVPLNLVLANIPGRYLPQAWTPWLFVLLDVGAFAIVAMKVQKRVWRVPVLDRDTRLVLFCMAGFLLYLPLAGAPLAWGGRIFEPVFSSDWEIRLPLLRASLQGGVPPHNPFFTYHGLSPAVRYYYYWFTLCAQVMRLVHTGARATLLASSAYAGLCLIATLFLCLKYLLPNQQNLRRRCLVLLGLCCVLGLDIVPSLLGLFTWNVRLQPEIEWWLTERSPGVLGATIYAPHHVAGAACGFLLLLLFDQLWREHLPALSRRTFLYGGVLGLIFAAMAGTSTFITIFFAATTSLLFLRALARREWALPLALLAATAFSLSLSLPYLRELTAKTVSAAQTSATHPPAHLVGLALRHSEQAHVLMVRCFQHAHRPLPGRITRLLLRSVLLAGMFVCETGFFLLIAVMQIRRDFRSRTALRPGHSSLWLLAGTVFVFFLLVTSAPVQSVNDLGVHAGLVLRMILILWGTQIVARYQADRAAHLLTPGQRRWVPLAQALLVLGIGTAVWQVTVERTYLMLLNAHAIPPANPFHGAHHLARLYSDMHDAEAHVGEVLPEAAVVQSNPIGPYQSIARLYELRRQAGGDQSCEGAFGGDPALCQSFMPELLGLFGTHGYRHSLFAYLPIRPENMQLTHLGEVCRAIGLTAVLASDADPVWYRKESWVWQGRLLAGNEHVRVVSCPAP